MNILIKDMEMPIDGCHHIICIYADGTVATGGREYRAVPVSEPHEEWIIGYEGKADEGET